MRCLRVDIIPPARTVESDLFIPYCATYIMSRTVRGATPCNMLALFFFSIRGYHLFFFVCSCQIFSVFLLVCSVQKKIKTKSEFGTKPLL